MKKKASLECKAGFFVFRFLIENITPAGISRTGGDVLNIG